MSSVVTITDADVSTEVQNADQPVLIYFWASWCGPCRLVAPTIDWVATNYSDRLKVLKMEVDPNPDSVAKYQVQGVPAFRLLKGNEVVISHEGAITKDKLVAMLDSHLSE